MIRKLLVVGAVIASGGYARCQETLYWEASQLQRCKAQMAAPSEDLETALRQLQINADKAMTEGPFSVTHKEMPPPSGDKHDYVSYARYWWPDRAKPDGLPYIRRDGESNYKLLANGDRGRFGSFVDAVRALSLASYFFEESRYGDRASELIRVWFLEPETRMNPHLEYAQGIPGKTDGRSLGVIDTRDFITVLDAVALLGHRGMISQTDQERLKDWFSEFFVWLQKSKLGRGEAAAKNNHGTWYDAQAARIALFVGDEDAARRIVAYAAGERIAEQFAADGAQPDELSRSQTLHYTYFNLEGFSVIARLGEHLGIELWSESSLGVGLEPGIRYVAPFTHSERPWPHPQTHSFALSLGAQGLLRMASVRYGDPRLLAPIPNTKFGHLENEYTVLVFAAIE